jgi:hypothetical protein
MIPAEGGCSVILGGGSAAWAAVPGTWAGIPGATMRFPEVGSRVGPLSTECFHLAGEVLDPLQKCVALWEWDNARERQLDCSLDDAVCTAARGVYVCTVCMYVCIRGGLLQPLHLDPQWSIVLNPYDR